MIIEYHQRTPNSKILNLLFNKQLGIKIPPSAMSDILKSSFRDKINKQEKIEVLNKRIRECTFPELERMIHLRQTIYYRYMS